jgi:hypothetical protein
MDGAIWSFGTKGANDSTSGRELPGFLPRQSQPPVSLSESARYRFPDQPAIARQFKGAGGGGAGGGGGT